MWYFTCVVGCKYVVAIMLSLRLFAMMCVFVSVWGFSVRSLFGFGFSSTSSTVLEVRVKILVNLPEELHCFGPASKRMYHTVVGVRELPSCMWKENENNWGRIQGTSSSLATAR